jgi:LysR family cyn operon transcriptional activator
MNLTQIELRHLRYFLAVAEESHFTRAAEKLHVTQPTLSHQIRELESQLNQPLFDRVGRRVKLTAAGEMLLPHARRVVGELAEAQTALNELQGLKRGVIKVGIVQTVNACVIPEIVARFSAAHPGISLVCREMAVADIESDLESGKLDLGISFLPPSRASLAGQKLFKEELVAVVAVDHVLAKCSRLRVRELSTHPMALLTEKYCTRHLIDRLITETAIQPHIKVEMNSVESLLSTVKRTDLLTLLPSLALCHRDPGLKALPLIEPTTRRNLGLLWLQGARRRAAAEAFAGFTATVLAERRLPIRSLKGEDLAKKVFEVP